MSFVRKLETLRKMCRSPLQSSQSLPIKNEKVIIKIQLLKTMRRSANEYRQIIMGNNVQLEIPVLD